LLLLLCWDWTGSGRILVVVVVVLLVTGFLLIDMGVMAGLDEELGSLSELAVSAAGSVNDSVVVEAVS